MNNAFRLQDYGIKISIKEKEKYKNARRKINYTKL